MKKTIEEIKQIPYEDLVALYFMAQSEVFDTRNIMQGVRQEAIDLKLELEHIKSSDVIISEDGCLHKDCYVECQKDKLTFSEPEGELVKVECNNDECIRGANYLKNHKLCGGKNV